MLTKKEKDILCMVGLPNKTIAEILGVSTRAVEKTLENVLYKLSVKSRTAAIIKALSAGLVSLSELEY